MRPTSVQRALWRSAVRGLLGKTSDTVAIDDATLVLAEAEQHRLHGLVAAQLAKSPQTQAVLKRCKQQAFIAQSSTRELIKRLQMTGIQVAVLKGTAVDEGLYGGRGWRSSSDVDLLVNDIDAACAALQPLQVDDAYEDSLGALRDEKSTRTLPCVLWGARVNVDVHARLLSTPFADVTDDIWDALDTRDGLPVLPWSMHIAFVAGNALAGGFVGAWRTVLDVALASKRASSSDVAYFTGRWGTGAGLWVLRERARTLGIDVPFNVDVSAWQRALLSRAVVDEMPGAWAVAVGSASVVGGAVHVVKHAWRLSRG
jgi:Uncharacterised nucleotidyltransferase